jgi:hypothetical protein
MKLSSFSNAWQYWGVVLLSLFALQPGLAAERVGVAAAVKPEATSQPPGGESSTLKIGKSVVYNERINTSSSGVVQVLLLDGSTFSVGPGSDLVIDKFVYNPATGRGDLVASFSKGALRFVGGKLSKNDPGVKVNTPAGELTVRGGIFQGKVQGSNRAIFAFVYGDHLSLNRGGKLFTLRSPGQVFDISGPGAPLMRAASQADTNILLGAVSGKKTQVASKSGKGKGWPYYYGIQPAGSNPDQPFVRQWYYSGAPTGLILNGATRVPSPPPPPPPPTDFNSGPLR